MSTAGDGIVGRWEPVEGPARAYIEFSENGEVSGNDGCNRFGNQRWRRDGDRVVCDGARIATMMFCEGVDTWLGRAEAFVVAGELLHALGADETDLGKLATAGR